MKSIFQFESWRIELAANAIKTAREAVKVANDRHVGLLPSGFYGWQA